MAIKAPQLRFAVLATDVVLFAVFDKKLHVLLVQVHRPPHFIHKWGLPGGLIRPKETAEKAASRYLEDKGGVKNAYIEQLCTFSGINRDPRGRVVSVAYLSLISNHKALKFEDDPHTRWCGVQALPKLAYDHNHITRTAVERLQGKLEYTNVVCNLLPKEFTLTELQHTYEIILRKKLDKRNFRKKILALGFVKKTGRKKRGEANRPAELYQFRTLSPQAMEML